MQGFTDQKFGRGVLAPDVGHHPGAGFDIDNISHGILRIGAVMAPMLVWRTPGHLLLLRGCGFGFRGQNPILHQSCNRLKHRDCN